MIQETNNKPRKKKIRSYPIIVLSMFYSVLIASMLIYICWYAQVHKQELINNNYNTRQQILVKQNARGTIYSRNGEVLACTKTDQDGSEYREYPYGNEFAHVVGYSTHGRMGIEALSNYYLINTSIDLSEKANYDKQGTKFPADSVTTTLDVNLQEVAYNALSARNGAVIVSNPKTGEILAMVSKPDFDPNKIATEWDKLIADKSPDAKLLNRATQGLYPPGSTFKIVTSLAYIRDNKDTYKNYKFTCNGSFTHEGNKISCFHGETHGNLDLYSSFAKSCNSSYASMGLSINRKTFAGTLDDLMFNKEIPVPITYNESRAICDSQTSDDEIMQLSIGQGSCSVTPIQMNLITNAIANDGRLMKPYLVQKVTCDDGKVVESFEPESYKKLMTKEEAEILKEMMNQVVQNGTASKLKGLSYTAAGKTGSAEFNSETSDSHAWFTGFAPYEDPEICVTIIVEDAGSGGSYAVPIAKRIFDAYFDAE